jgi:hypothetical protein
MSAPAMSTTSFGDPQCGELPNAYTLPPASSVH